MAQTFPSNRRKCEVLLIHPPWFRLQGSSLVPYPVGPGYLAGILEQEGIDALIWNSDFDPSAPLSIGGTNILKTDEMMQAHERYRSRLNDLDDPIWDEVMQIVEMTSPRVIGLSVYSASFKSACNVARIVKERHPEILIVFGGVHATIDPEGCLRESPDCDVVVHGEAELSAGPLFSALIAGRTGPEDLAGLQGVAFLDKGRFIKTERPPAVTDLDSLPPPARHRIIDLDKMPPHAFQAIYGFRGCPYRCIFCGSFNVFGRKPRYRSAESMAEEIHVIHKTYGTRYFYICDDIFMLKRDRAIEFCSIMKRKQLPIYYSIQARGETVDADLLRELKATGCQHIAVGVEVGDEEIRRLIKKGNTVEDMRKAARLIKEAGLRMVGFFMFGFPWETREQMLKTADLMEELEPCIAFPYIVTPAPGTELFDIALDMGLISGTVDWSSFSHVSPQMGLTSKLEPEERKELIDAILNRFTKHNRDSLRWDWFRRPRFYFAAARDAGVFSSPLKIIQYLRALL